MGDATPRNDGFQAVGEGLTAGKPSLLGADGHAEESRDDASSGDERAT